MKKSCKRFLFSSLAFVLVSCASSYLKYEKPEVLQVNKEFEEQVVISPVDPTTSPPPPTELPVVPPLPPQVEEPKDKKSDKKTKKKNSVTAQTQATAVTPAAPPRRQPEIEDGEGFVGRRPIVDPFRVGEVVEHDVHYFKVSAGYLYLKVEPFVQVNGRKSYTFATEIKSSRMFSTVYSVDDRAVTLIDYDLLIPRVFTLHVKESGQLREAKSFFDFDQLKATYWEKKVTEKSGVEEKKIQWEILDYSQNVFSAIHYMRIFKWDIGKEYAFRVADEGENLVFKGKALRKEILKTEAGEFKSIVVKPEILVKGAFKPVGDIYIWLSDDDRKFVLKIESNIRIGTIVSEVTSINPGK